MAIYPLNWDELPPVCCRHGAVAIGNFDGVHRGHLKLLAELRQRASAVRGAAVALTFDPHPLQLLRPEAFQPLLTTAANRASLLEAHGADYVLILRTTLEFLQLTAEEFFHQVVRAKLAARVMVEGVNFGFGHNREGNVETLRSLCGRAGILLGIVPPVTALDGMTISSSRVRKALVGGDVRAAAALLGRPYALHGIVARGERRGQTLGFPTANLTGIETLIPGDGVFAVRVHHQGDIWPAAANIGPNPTFGEAARKVEVHLIGFRGTLYGQALAVDFLERLRDTRPFASAGQLVEQLRADVEQARQIASQVP